MEYKFGRDKSFNGGNDFVLVVSEDPIKPLEDRQHVIISNDQEIITHDFDVVGELARKENVCGLNYVWYGIKNHTVVIDKATRIAEANSATIDDILVSLLGE